MRRPVAGVWDVPAGRNTPALIVTAAAFFLGGVVGFILTSKIEGAAADSLSAYMQAFLAAAQTGAAQPPALLPLLWQVLRWPILTVLLGFTAFGLPGIPVLFAVRGFLFSFSIASFVRVLGGYGMLLAVLVFGISGLIALPALFILGVQGLAASRCLAGRSMGEGKTRSPYGKLYFLRCGLCAAAFLVCVVVEYLAVPSLVAVASHMPPG